MNSTRTRAALARCLAASGRQSCPFTSTRPEVLRTPPDMAFSRGDLPAPLGPRMAASWPSLISKETFFTTGVW